MKKRALVFSLLVLVALVASTLAGCTAQSLDGGSRHAFFVRTALAPPVHAAAAACQYATDATAPPLLQGHVDLGIADTYQLTLLAQVTDGSGSTSITGAHVVLETADQQVLREFDAATTGFIQPGVDGLASVTVLDAPARDTLLAKLPNRQATATLIANVTLSGRDAAGGPDVMSPVFSFPIVACNGCLVDFSTGNDPKALVQPNCLAPRAPTAPTPCVLGQDEPVACQLCVGSRSVCDPSRQ